MNAKVVALKPKPVAPVRSPENNMPDRDANIKAVKLVTREQYDHNRLGTALKHATPKAKLQVSFNILSIMVALFLIWLLYLVH